MVYLAGGETVKVDKVAELVADATKQGTEVAAGSIMTLRDELDFGARKGHVSSIDDSAGHRAHVLEIKSQLPRAELEPWDRGWSRLYETLPAVQLDEGVLDGAVDCLCDYIVTLQPLLNSWLGDRHGSD